MSLGELTLTEYTWQLSYCRRYNGTDYDDYDSEAGSYDRSGAGTLMWEDTDDYMYWGHSSAFLSLGFFKHTSGDYGALTWEYYTTGSGWTSFTPFHDSTSGFSRNGYIAWEAQSVPSWAATTVDGTNAYWVRASVASVATAAKFYSFLRNLTLSPPLRLMPSSDLERFSFDISGGIVANDIAYTGPNRLSVQCFQPSIGMANIGLLYQWWHDRTKLYIDDEATSTTPDPDTDAYFKQYVGYLTEIRGEVESPSKMAPQEYSLEFAIQSVSTMM